MNQTESIVDQTNFFEKVCVLVVFNLLPNFNNVSTFGKRFYIHPEDRTLASPQFFIRFTDGSVVMLVWDDTHNALNVAVAFDGGSEADGAFIQTYKNTMLSVMNPTACANIQACKSNPQSWGDGTWFGELMSSIIMILNYEEAGKLAELFSKNGTDSDSVKHVDITPKRV